MRLQTSRSCQGIILHRIQCSHLGERELRALSSRVDTILARVVVAGAHGMRREFVARDDLKFAMPTFRIRVSSRPYHGLISIHQP